MYCCSGCSAYAVRYNPTEGLRPSCPKAYFQDPNVQYAG
jgi:hypothetical protein